MKCLCLNYQHSLITFEDIFIQCLCPIFVEGLIKDEIGFEILVKSMHFSPGMALPLEQIKVKLCDMFIYSVGTLRVLNLEKLICILKL